VKLLRNKLLLVAVVCAAPFVLGTAAYLLGWSPGGAANYGELIAPRLLAGSPFAELRGKWVMVSFDAAACDAHCEKKLYFMRQVRRAQGKHMDRVERLWLVSDGAKPRPELLAAIEGTRLASASPDGFPGNAADHIYLVDPIGNLMMRFPREPDPSKMIKDLQRLLKYSGAG
jgi:cytochrome oxidase Cu insertion factor (SCO1/SenC/PrrC family)